MKKELTVHNSQLTKKLSALVPQCLSASWIIRVRTALAVRFQAVSQLCHSLRLPALTGWVRYAHTAPYRKSAFTLAETLIVIGIIGVVAALTLPNLNHATGDKEKVTRVKKIYSALNDAYDRAQVVYGNANTWWNYAYDLAGDDIACHKLFADRISEFMKISSNDGFNIKLSDGTMLYISVWQPNQSIYHPGQEFLGYIDVDIDGQDKGKNERGYDIFRFEMTDQGIYPEGINEESISYIFKGYSQTIWVLENENMDYLKADENGVCPNGKQLSWTVTSCN